MIAHDKIAHTQVGQEVMEVLLLVALVVDLVVAVL